MQLEGTLDQFSMRELIEMIVYSSVTGVLEVRVGGDVGRLFFRDGLPYHADLSALVGFDALCRMFEERDAPFRFVSVGEAKVETLWGDPWDLIARAQDLASQWAQVRSHIPDLTVVPLLRSADRHEAVHISETSWSVLSVVDGQRTVLEIADVLCVAPLDVCHALVALLDQGMVTVRRSGLLSADVQPSAQPASGLLKRLQVRAAAPDIDASSSAQASLPPRVPRE